MGSVEQLQLRGKQRKLETILKYLPLILIFNLYSLLPLKIYSTQGKIKESITGYFAVSWLTPYVQDKQILMLNIYVDVSPQTSTSCFLCNSDSCSDSASPCCFADSSACDLHISALNAHSRASSLLLSASLLSLVFFSADSPLNLSS